MFDLKQFRRVNGITQAELAKYLEVSEPFISQVESGKNKLPKDKLDRLLNNDRGWDTKTFRIGGLHIDVGASTKPNTSASNRTFEQIRILTEKVEALEKQNAELEKRNAALEKQNAEYWDMLKQLITVVDR